MVTLTVKFMGLCLFHSSSKTPVDDVLVLLPDTNARSHHRDGLPVGLPHHAALLIPEGAGRKVVPLRRAVISFSSEAVPGDRDLSELVGVEDLAEDLGIAVNLPGDLRVAAWTVLEGGALVTVADYMDDTPGKVWLLTPNLPPGQTVERDSMGVSVDWIATFQEDVVVVTVTPRNGQPREFPFTQDTTIYIVNVCMDPDDAPTAQPKKKLEKGRYLRDDDFKWYYNLLESCTIETIEERLEFTPSGTLPIPVAHLPGKVDLSGVPIIQRARRKQKDIGVDTPTCLCAHCGCPEC